MVGTVGSATGSVGCVGCSAGVALDIVTDCVVSTEDIVVVDVPAGEDTVVVVVAAEFDCWRSAEASFLGVQRKHKSAR